MHNIGRIDRIIRVLVAAAILISYITEWLPPDWTDPSLAVAVLLVFTSLRKCCPLYALLGFGTCTTVTSQKEPRINVKKMDL